MINPLANIRIVDFTHMIAGPLCTQLLADLGALVIKIEPPGGETSRQLGNVRFGDHTSYFWSFNRNKSSYVCDFQNPEDMCALEKLLATADVLVENFRPGILSRLGLPRKKLEAIKPDIIACSIAGFDPQDPDYQRPAVDPIIQSLSGAMEVNGTLETGPLKIGLPVGDVVAPLYASSAILFALMRRQINPGKPQHINVSMLGSLISSLAPHDFATRLTGDFPVRERNEHPQISPANTYQASDGRYVTTFAPNNKHWNAILNCIGDGTAPLRRLQTAKERSENREEIDRCLRAEIIKHPASYWNRKAQDCGALIVPVNRLKDIAIDPTINKVYYQILPSGAVVARTPIRISDPPTTLLSAQDPPTLGLHIGAAQAQVDEN